jgi:uncharacterized protein YukE
MEVWVDAVRNVGIPAVILLGIGFLVWRGGAWVGEVILRPAVEMHLEFMKAMSKAVERLVAVLEELSQAIKNVEDRHRQVMDVIQKGRITNSDQVTQTERAARPDDLSGRNY